MKKVTEITKKTSVKKLTGKTANLWNCTLTDAKNTCDYIAELNGWVKLNFGLVGPCIVVFIDSVKPSCVLGTSTTIDELNSIDPVSYTHLTLPTIYSV